jgi:hypothetical protein
VAEIESGKFNDDLAALMGMAAGELRSRYSERDMEN